MRRLKDSGPKRSRQDLAGETSEILDEDGPLFQGMKSRMKWTLYNVHTLHWASVSKEKLTAISRAAVDFGKKLRKNQPWCDADPELTQTKFHVLLSALPDECYEKFPKGMQYQGEIVTDAKRLADLAIQTPTGTSAALLPPPPRSRQNQ